MRVCVIFPGDVMGGSVDLAGGEDLNPQVEDPEGQASSPSLPQLTLAGRG